MSRTARHNAHLPRLLAIMRFDVPLMQQQSNRQVGRADRITESVVDLLPQALDGKEAWAHRVASLQTKADPCSSRSDIWRRQSHLSGSTALRRRLERPHRLDRVHDRRSYTLQSSLYGVLHFLAAALSD